DSRFSPGLRARTKTARSCCREEAGKKRSWCNVNVAHPSEAVCASGGIENCEYGTPVTYTSAFCTGRPLQAETWIFTVRSVVELVIGVGEACWPSISSSAGSDTSFTSTVPEPEVG